MKIKFDLEKRDSICYIFGAGEFYGLYTRPREGDLVIAADGGLKYLEDLGIAPDIIVGDFDSGSRAETEIYLSGNDKASECEKVELLTVKDRSDSAEAILIGKKRGYRCFCLYGCTGGRLDHTLASLQDMAALSAEGAEAYLFDKGAAITVITDSAISFPAGFKGTVSVFSYTEESKKVRESGLKYLVADHQLNNRFPLGLSNEFTDMEARISVGDGSLLIYFDLPKNNN